MNEIEEELFCTKYELKTLSDLVLKGEAERWVKGFLHSKYEMEHIERYRFALQFVNNKNVLDIACGSGYGSFLIAEQGNALKVTGVDLDADAVRYGNFRYAHHLVNRFVDDATKYSSATPFDVTISYETVEHLSDYRLFLKNIDQNLAEDGTFIISTPISKNTTIKPNHNPYHEIEWSYSDFTKLLQEYFILKDTFIQNAVIEGNYPEYTLTNRIKNRLGKKITKSDSQFFEGIKAAHELKVNELDAGYIIAVLNKK